MGHELVLPHPRLHLIYVQLFFKWYNVTKNNTFPGKKENSTCLLWGELLEGTLRSSSLRLCLSLPKAIEPSPLAINKHSYRDHHNIIMRSAGSATEVMKLAVKSGRMNECMSDKEEHREQKRLVTNHKMKVENEDEE